MRTHYGPWQPCWISNQHQKHKSGRGPSSEHFWQVWLISVQRFQRRRFKCEKLTDGRRTLTHDKSSHGLWPGELKRGDEINKKSSPLKLLGQFQPNFAEMILGWYPFKFVSVSAVLYPRWPPLLKIEISSNGQNCSILSQKLSKFELYKHNDELFNMYYRIFYEL